jgi:hypothetical protein
VNVDVGRDVGRLFGRVFAPRLRIELLQHLRGFVDLLDRLSQILGDRLVVLLLEVGEVLGDDPDHDVVVRADVARLNQQALLERRAPRHRIEFWIA